MPTGPERRLRGEALAVGLSALVAASGPFGCDGCAGVGDGERPGETEPSGAASSSALPGFGPSPSPFPAFSVDAPAEAPLHGAQAMGLLDAEIAELRGLRMPGESEVRVRLATRTLERFDALRLPADLQVATDLVTSMRSSTPASEDVRVLQAELALARGELRELVGPHDRARLELSALPRIAEIQAEALLAQGRCEQALGALRALPAGTRSPRRAALDAVVLVALGRDAEADERFREVARAHRDPSPSNLARVYLEHAEFLKARGAMDAAQNLYGAALWHAPWYQPALVAQSELVHLDVGLAHLATAAQKAGSPEVLTKFAQLRELRTPGDGASTRVEALKAYEAAVEIAPKRYRTGLARFRMVMLDDARRGFELAAAALEEEPRPEALAVLLDAARLTDRVADYCALAERSELGAPCTPGGELPASILRCR